MVYSTYIYSVHIVNSFPNETSYAQLCVESSGLLHATIFKADNT